MSTPISATSTRATVSLTPGIVVSRSAASRKGRSTSSACCSSFCTAARNASICPRCSSSRKRWCAVVHRGDDVRAVGFQAPGGAIGQPLGIGLPGDERRQDRPAADAQDVGDHVRQLHVRVFERLLQALRVPRDLADQLLAGPRGRAVPGSGPAARSCPESARAPVGEAASFRSCGPERSGCALASTSVNDPSSRVPHRLVHAGRLHRHVRAARLGQPGRQLPSVANSRCSVVTFRPAAMRTHAFTREWTSNPAQYKTPSVTSCSQRRWRGVRRYEIYRARSPEESPVCNTGCSRDSGSNSRIEKPTSYTISCFMNTRVPPPGGELKCVRSSA